MRERVPLATIQDAVLEFLRGRGDAALFGAQAVNACVDQPRMTQEVDILSTRAKELAEELRRFLQERFQMAVRVRAVAGGRGYRVYQVRRPKHRHLADVRNVERLPACKGLRKVLIRMPAELIAHKVLSMTGRPKNAEGLPGRGGPAPIVAEASGTESRPGSRCDQLAGFGRVGSSDRSLAGIGRGRDLARRRRRRVLTQDKGWRQGKVQSGE